MKPEKNKLFLYFGLALLLVAIIGRHVGLSNLVWIPIFSLALLLKGIFLFNVFRAKGLKMDLSLILIITGVFLILISLIFKFIFPILWLRNILFYGAITLKVTGLIIKITSKKTKTL